VREIGPAQQILESRFPPKRIPQRLARKIRQAVETLFVRVAFE
jgi:hypothetical protein